MAVAAVGLTGRAVLFELLQLLLSDRLEVLDVEEQAQPQLDFHLALALLEEVFADGRDVQVMSEYPLDQLLGVFVRPVEALLGVEVDMVQRVVLVADLLARQGSPHLLSVPLVVDLRAFHTFINPEGKEPCTIF